MTITLTFNGYGELKTFCQQILGQEPERPKELANDTKPERPKKKGDKKLKDILEGVHTDKHPGGRKLSAKKANMVVEDYDTGMSVGKIAMMYGISGGSVLKALADAGKDLSRL